MGRGSLKALSLACAGIGVFLKCERSIYVKDTLLASNIALSLALKDFGIHSVLRYR